MGQGQLLPAPQRQQGVSEGTPRARSRGVRPTDVGCPAVERPRKGRARICPLPVERAYSRSPGFRPHADRHDRSSCGMSRWISGADYGARSNTMRNTAPQPSEDAYFRRSYGENAAEPCRSSAPANRLPDRVDRSSDCDDRHYEVLGNREHNFTRGRTNRGVAGGLFGPGSQQQKGGHCPPEQIETRDDQADSRQAGGNPRRLDRRRHCLSRSVDRHCCMVARARLDGIDPRNHAPAPPNCVLARSDSTRHERARLPQRSRNLPTARTQMPSREPSDSADAPHPGGLAHLPKCVFAGQRGESGRAGS